MTESERRFTRPRFQLGSVFRYHKREPLNVLAMLVRVDRDEQIFDPALIRSALAQIGVEMKGSDQGSLPLRTIVPDEELWLVERVMRIFLRANQVNEDLIRTKLGVKASQFFEDVLPDLLTAGILEIIPYFGHGSQKRFRMRVKMQKLHDALAAWRRP